MLLEIQVLVIMSITVKIYGDLRNKIEKEGMENGLPITLNLEEDKIKSINDVISSLKIKQSDVSHIFVNGSYSGEGTRLKDGDRVGIFPSNMAAMFVEIPDSNSFYITVKLFATLRKYGEAKLRMKVLNGTTLKNIITKMKIPKEEGKLIILVNGIPQWDRDLVVNANDTVAIFPPLAGG